MSKETLTRLLLEGARVVFGLSCAIMFGGMLWIYLDPQKLNQISFGPPFAIMVIAAITGFTTLLAYQVGYFEPNKEVTP